MPKSRHTLTTTGPASTRSSQPNVIRIFYASGRGHEVRRTLDAMIAMAEARAYEFSMHYYMHQDWFFYYLSDLCRRNPERVELANSRSLLRERLAERSSGKRGCGTWDNDALAASLRLVAANNLGMDNPRDLEVVLRTQQRDGAWSKEAWVWRYGHGVLAENPGLITAFAVKGLRGVSEKLKKDFCLAETNRE
ncbi:Sesquiterpene cyclase astC [Apiospora phragmitis]|uniref:Sesquiterpene cyclase astC n=1 Tax=Apiospora phragmitis TaxID=2905665 RepID=A0ABR1T8L3_9PEZI